MSASLNRLIMNARNNLAKLASHLWLSMTAAIVARLLHLSYWHSFGEWQAQSARKPLKSNLPSLKRRSALLVATWENNSVASRPHKTRCLPKARLTYCLGALKRSFRTNPKTNSHYRITTNSFSSLSSLCVCSVNGRWPMTEVIDI